tara:strand:+ start:344 stop:697 length:354 start_codon:yes stop_codon:yes gene_type:complete
MVDTVSVNRINIRDMLSVDIEVWMKHPDDMDFKPRLKIVENTLIISNGESHEALTQFDLEDEHILVAQRDRRIELRVKFQVHGMHGRLNIINPIIADGKAKKLATANWKTVQPVAFE